MARSRPNRYRGKLIAVEGIDARGRSVQVALLEAWLRGAGVPVAVRENLPVPAATPITTSLLQAANLAELIESDIVPLLRSGLVVCANGYVCSASAEDSARGLSRKWIRNLYQFAVLPNIRIYYRLPLDAALRQPPPPPGVHPQLSATPEENFRLFQGRLVEELDAIAEELNFHVVDATRAPDEQQRDLRDLVRRELPLENDAPAA